MNSTAPTAVGVAHLSIASVRSPEAVSAGAPSGGSNDFGALLRGARESLGLSQTRLAELAGVSRTHLCRMERQGRLPSRAVVRRLVEALSVGGTSSREHHVLQSLVSPAPADFDDPLELVSRVVQRVPVTPPDGIPALRLDRSRFVTSVAWSRLPSERALPREDGVVRTAHFDHNGMPAPVSAMLLDGHSGDDSGVGSTGSTSRRSADRSQTKHANR